MRWRVLAALFLLSFITIVDRVAISAAKSEMAAELGISDITFGVVFGAFALGYGVFMAPSGWVADRWGPRRFLALIVGLWSLFTLQTGLVSAAGVLIAIRFLFGAAEAGAYPTAARAIYTWMPARERGLALGLLNTGSRLGAAIGLTLMSFSVAALGWRASFVVLGAAGFAWAAFWLLWFRDTPEEKSGGAAARQPGGNWRELVSRNTALILVQYFASNFTFFLCFSWLLPYLRSHYSLGPREAGFYASIPLYAGVLATSTSGLVVDAIYRRGHWGLSRRLPAMFGFALAAVCLIAASRATSMAGFLVFFTITTFGVDFTLSPSWSVSSDIGRQQTGTLSAAMNTLGSIGSFASSVVFPRLLAQTGSVTTHFVLAAALDVVAVVCWWNIRPERARAAGTVSTERY